MAPPSTPKPVLIIAAVISRHDSAFCWAREKLAQTFGKIALCSDSFDHQETTYYQATMGADLKKWFVAFAKLADCANLADWKLTTNQLEEDYAQLTIHEEQRPLNLDPGYITEAKLVLATTKDRDHRIYLRNGIYAEVTLRYQAGGWRNQLWTYPDYQRADFHDFFLRCREYLRSIGKE
jgi:hypothetical protein